MIKLAPKTITKILLILLSINLVIIICALLMMSLHVKKTDDIRAIRELTSVLKNFVIADKNTSSTTELDVLKKHYANSEIKVSLTASPPKTTLLLTRDGLIVSTNLTALINQLRATNNISVSTYLQQQQKWVNVSAQRKFFLPREQTALLLFFGILLPTVSFALIGMIYIIFRRKSFVANVKKSLLEDKTTSSNDSETAEHRLIAELKQSVQTLINDKILFQTSIAHDINTCIFRLRLKTAKLKNLDPSLPQELDFISDIIKSSLVLAKYDKNSLPRETLDLTSLLEKFNEVFYPSSSVVKFVLSDQYIPIKANAKLLNRILHNLIDNAIKYANLVQILAKTQDGFAYLICKDDGPGIPEQDMEKLLHPFEQNDKSNLGVGLGLAIIDKITQLQQAEFILRNSKHGHGLLAILKFKLE